MSPNTAILLALDLTVTFLILIKYIGTHRLLRNMQKKLLQEDEKIVNNIRHYEETRLVEMGLMRHIISNEYSLVEMEKFLTSKFGYSPVIKPKDYEELLLQLIENMRKYG